MISPRTLAHLTNQPHLKRVNLFQVEANCSEVLPVLDQIYEVQVQHNKFIILLKMFNLNKIHPEVIQKFLDKLSEKVQRQIILYCICLYLRFS